MKKFIPVLTVFCSLLVLSSCTSTKQLTISTIEPSPVDFSNQIRKIGIINNSKSFFVRGYANRLEQLIVMEEKWLAEKGTEAALTGLFNELMQDERFDTVQILDNSKAQTSDFGTQPSAATWEKIESICEENGVDALFSLASHDTETQISLKKTKMTQNGMMREKQKVAGQEITLETLIENGWRIYDPRKRRLVDEFTSNDEIVASGKGVSPVDALKAINKRRDTLLAQSTNSGISYAQRMLPQRLNIQRNYYISGSKIFGLADDKIQAGEYQEAMKLLEKEISNDKPRIRAKACYNLAVLNEFNGNLNSALHWATKSYDAFEEDNTLNYISDLEGRLAQNIVLKEQVANLSFVH